MQFFWIFNVYAFFILLYLFNPTFRDIVKNNNTFFEIFFQSTSVLIAYFAIRHSIKTQREESIQKYPPVIIVRRKNPDIEHDQGYANSSFDDKANTLKLRFVLNNCGDNIARDVHYSLFINVDGKNIELENTKLLSVLGCKAFTTITREINFDKEIIKNNGINKESLNCIDFTLRLKYKGLSDKVFETESKITIMIKSKDKENINCEDGKYFVYDIDNDFKVL